jgi:hypothetical protein
VISDARQVQALSRYVMQLDIGSIIETVCLYAKSLYPEGAWARFNNGRRYDEKD